MNIKIRNVYEEKNPYTEPKIAELEKEIERLNKELEKYKYTADELNEIERLNNIINELDKQNGELGAELSITKDTINKTNWWLEQMLKQATNMETKAIISGTLELLLGSDKE